MRLVFMGTPAFAVPTLERAAAAGHSIAAVFTQPDRPAGRGGKLSAPPVKQAALALGIPVHQPAKIRTAEVHDLLRSFGADAFVVVGYGKIIPESIIAIPPLGIINVHASLLPKYRGAAPIQWAIANGETRTGVTTMQIDAGLDTGAILLQSATEVGLEETAVELSARLAQMGADLLVETLAGLSNGTIKPRPQDDSEASYAPVLRKEDGLIDWSQPAAAINNRIRGFQPWPGCYTHFRGRLLHIWRARVAAEAAGPAGSLHPGRGGLAVACGAGTALQLLEVQLEGGRRMDAAAFQNGQRVKENELLGEGIK
ncbi:MAG: methionyl-tRNA formyltransferase [bacterium]|jgi:methionyl-tRNA formyltransferase